CDTLTPVRLDPAQHQLMLRLLEYAQDPPHAVPDDPHRLALDTDCPALTAEQLTAPRPAPPPAHPASPDSSTSITAPVPSDPHHDPSDTVAQGTPPAALQKPPAPSDTDRPSVSRPTAHAGAARNTAAADK